MATARQEAIKSLGTFDTSAYKDLKSTAKDTYNTSVAEYGNTYNQLLNRLNDSRQTNSQNFTQGRGAVEIPAVIASRQARARQDAAGRGESDFDRYNNIDTAIRVGNQYNSLADTFYNNVKDYNLLEQEGKSAYDLGLRSAKDAYDASIANINLSKQQAQNSYNQAVAQLAEQIQSRWDSNANAQNELEEKKKAWAQQTAAINQQTARLLLSGIDKNTPLSQLMSIYPQLKSYGFTDTEIQNEFKNLTGTAYDYTIDADGNIIISLPVAPVKKLPKPTGTNTSIIKSSSDVNLPSPTPYSDMFLSNNPYFNR